MTIDYQNMELLRKVWERGVVVDGYNPSEIRKDAAGAWIIFDRYRKDDPFGWEIDHVYPKKMLEDMNVDKSLWDDLLNLRPMNYANNRSKGASYPNYIARIKSEGDTNVDCNESFTVNLDLQEALKNLFGI